MADNGYMKIVIGFLLFGLFTVLIVNAIYQMAINYDVPSEKVNEATGGALNITDLESELNDGDVTTENFRERFESGEVEDVDDAGGILSVISDVISVFLTPYKLIGNVAKNILGIPEIVTHVILSIINISLLFLGWRVLRAGS